MAGKAEQTRRMIIETVAPIFNAKGYAGTSISDLARATGLTKGAIYGNFRDKDEVALEAFRHNVAALERAVAGRLSGRGGAVERLLDLVRVWREFQAERDCAGGCPILNTASEADDTHPALMELARGVLRKWTDGVARVVEAGLASGEVRADADPTAFAQLMVALCEGGGFLARATGERGYLDRALDHAESLARGLARHG